MSERDDDWLQPSRCSDTPMTAEDVEETIVLFTAVTGDNWRAIFRGVHPEGQVGARD